LRYIEAMITTSFGSFNSSILLDGLEPDGEDVYATDAPDHNVAHRPVLVHVPPVGSRKGLRARAFGTREREQHDHEEERKLDFPMDRHVDGGDDRENEA
jgi:hypothetical protein